MSIRSAFCVLVAQLLLGSFNVPAQTLPEVIRFKSSGFDVAATMAKDASGNIYIAGSIPRNNQQTAFAVLKYDSQGRHLWTARYLGSQGGFNGSAAAVSVDSAGNVFAVGYVQPELVSRSFDYLVVKFNSNGIEQWARRIMTGFASKVIVEPSGNVYVSGSVSSFAGSDWLTTKYATDGTRLWERRFTSVSVGEQPATMDSVSDMALDSSGNLIVTGTSQALGNGLPFDFTTIKYDSNGNELFRATFNDIDQSNDLPFDLDVDPNGNIWVTGITEVDIYNPTLPITLKYAPDGQLLLTLRNETAGGRSVDVDASGNAFLAGNSAAAKFDSSGNKIWEKTLNLPPVKILADSAGNAYVSGSFPRCCGTSGDYLTVKLDPNGTQIFEHRFNGIGNGQDTVSDILLDNSENLYVVGTSRIDSSSFEDIVALKFLRGNQPAPQTLVAPSNLEAFAVSRQEITISWQDNSSNEAGFRIERCQGASCTNFTQVAEVGANVNNFLDSGLAKNKVYRYRVLAFNAGGNSDFSNIASGRTLQR